MLAHCSSFQGWEILKKKRNRACKRKKKRSHAWTLKLHRKLQIFAGKPKLRSRTISHLLNLEIRSQCCSTVLDWSVFYARFSWNIHSLVFACHGCFWLICLIWPCEEGGRAKKKMFCFFFSRMNHSHQLNQMVWVYLFLNFKFHTWSFLITCWWITGKWSCTGSPWMTMKWFQFWPSVLSKGHVRLIKEGILNPLICIRWLRIALAIRPWVLSAYFQLGPLAFGPVILLDLIHVKIYPIPLQLYPHPYN